MLGLRMAAARGLEASLALAARHFPDPRAASRPPQDKANRMNVRSAIAAVEDALCGYKAVPSTGLAIFAGPCV